MFSGLVEDVGRLAEIRPGPTTDLWIETRLGASDFALGESICVHGACLTVARTRQDAFCVQATPETLRRTTLGKLTAGAPLHLERALKLGDRLGGHLVLGHVDGLVEVLAAGPEGGSWVMELSLPPELEAFFIAKGSVALDGVSLTVNTLSHDRFSVALIPETQSRTVLAQRQVGEPLNVEADVIGKYVARLHALRADPRAGLTLESLRAAGFGG
jgi:riboflavin synthase